MPASSLADAGIEPLDVPDLAPADCVPGAIEAPLRRLSGRELRATLVSLFGQEPIEGASSRLAAIPSDLYEDVAALGISHSEAHVDGIVSLMEHIAERFLVPGALTEFGYECLEDEPPSDDCVRGFVNTMGARIQRRPMEEGTIAERVEVMAMFGPREGAVRVLMMALTSPHFLFHLETEGTEATDVDGRAHVVLDDFVIANRLSYGLTGTMPDGNLWRLAVEGQLRSTLDNADEREALFDEIWNDLRTREHVVRLFRDWLGVEAAPPITEATLARAGMEGDVRQGLLDEFDRYVEHIVFDREEGLDTLLRDPSQHGDATIDSVFSAADPARGLLLRPAVLLREDTITSPILRGVFVRRRILCETLDPPEADVVAARQDEVGDLDPASHTTRTVIDEITGGAACQTCHRRINPVSFALESFDALGRFRARQSVFDAEGAVVAMHPIDTAVSLPLDGESILIDGPEELVDVLARSEAVQRCFVRQVVERPRVSVLGPDGACLERQVFDHSMEGGTVRALLFDALTGPTLTSRALERADE